MVVFKVIGLRTLAIFMSGDCYSDEQDLDRRRKPTCMDDIWSSCTLSKGSEKRQCSRKLSSNYMPPTDVETFNGNDS